MTSMPASRSALAMTFAPRSWPSSPGLATSTRIGGFMSDRRLFFPYSEYVFQGGAYLADRGVSAHGIEQRRHQIHAARGGAFQPFQSAPGIFIIAPRAQPPQLFALRRLRGAVDAQHVERLIIIFLTAVHPRNDRLAGFNFALILKPGARNFGLRIAAFNGHNHPAHRIHLFDIGARQL